MVCGAAPAGWGMVEWGVALAGAAGEAGARAAAARWPAWPACAAAPSVVPAGATPMPSAARAAPLKTLCCRNRRLATRPMLETKLCPLQLYCSPTSHALVALSPLHSFDGILACARLCVLPPCNFLCWRCAAASHRHQGCLQLPQQMRQTSCAAASAASSSSLLPPAHTPFACTSWRNVPDSCRLAAWGCEARCPHHPAFEMVGWLPRQHTA